jgi:quercetin dioxygenase-like cupin family protein
VRRKTTLLRPGDIIRFPRHVRHGVRAPGHQPAFAPIIFSSGLRTAVDPDGGGVA